jgi:hypothetical protein
VLKKNVLFWCVVFGLLVAVGLLLELRIGFLAKLLAWLTTRPKT